MDAGKVTTKIMLATKRSGTVRVWANMWLKPIRIMRSHVRFQIERPGKG